MQQLNPTLWRTCRVLSGQTRLRLLRQIFNNPDQNVSQMAESVKIGESDASQELRRLQSRGLLRRYRKGLCVFYRPLADPQVSSAAPLLKALKISMSTSSAKDEEIIRIAKALAHERRILISKTLIQSPQNASALSVCLRIHPNLLRQHLQLLIAGGFIRQKNWMLTFQPPTHPLAQVLTKLLRKTMERNLGINKASTLRENMPTEYHWLKDCQESDFDGHSEFASLTPSQRLEWLSQAGDLIRALKDRAHPATPSPQ